MFSAPLTEDWKLRLKSLKHLQGLVLGSSEAAMKVVLDDLLSFFFSNLFLCVSVSFEFLLEDLFHLCQVKYYSMSSWQGLGIMICARSILGLERGKKVRSGTDGFAWKPQKTTNHRKMAMACFGHSKSLLWSSLFLDRNNVWTCLSNMNTKTSYKQTRTMDNRWILRRLFHTVWLMFLISPNRPFSQGDLPNGRPKETRSLVARSCVQFFLAAEKPCSIRFSCRDVALWVKRLCHLPLGPEVALWVKRLCHLPLGPEVALWVDFFPFTKPGFFRYPVFLTHSHFSSRLISTLALRGSTKTSFFLKVSSVWVKISTLAGESAELVSWCRFQVFGWVGRQVSVRRH